MGRPRKYLAREVVSAIAETEGVVKAAADLLGCSPVTVYAYADRYPSVRAALEGGRRQLVAEAQGRLVDMMRDADHRYHYKAVKDILVAYDEVTDWSNRSQVTGPAGGPLEIRGVKVINFNRKA